MFPPKSSLFTDFTFCFFFRILKCNKKIFPHYAFCLYLLLIKTISVFTSVSLVYMVYMCHSVELYVFSFHLSHYLCPV